MTKEKKPQWVADMKRYEQSKTGRAIWQLTNTFVPYVALWALLVWMIGAGVPYAITLVVMIPAAMLVVRLFMFLHDAGHGSFFPDQRANRIVGRILGVLTFTSYDEFRYIHGVHHSTVGNLDRRGMGDVWTMTVDEYKTAAPIKRLHYRLYRQPLVLFVVGSAFTFLVRNRFPTRGVPRKAVWGVLLTDLGIAVLATVLSLTIGLRTYLLIQIPVIFLAGMMGIWLFYIQHQFDPAYWARNDEWGSLDASLIGSSHYVLPKFLQWATANIGMHHIHHLRPRIPNYSLERCLVEVPEVQLENPLTLKRSFRSLRLNLWDEDNHRLVSFREVHLGEKKKSRKAGMPVT